MKESEFIELLNLYVDHEISAEDAARLEAAVMADLGRRRVYRQYCSMDKACSLLAAKFAETAVPAAPIEARAPGWSWGTGLSLGGLMAAAGVALVLVVRSHFGAAVGANPASDLAVHPSAPAPAVEASSSLAVYDRPLQSVMAMRNLSLNADYPAVDVLLRSNGQNDPLAWIARTQMGALPAPVNFHAPQGILAPDTTAVSATAAQTPVVEQAAFRFQR